MKIDIRVASRLYVMNGKALSLRSKVGSSKNYSIVSTEVIAVPFEQKHSGFKPVSSRASHQVFRFQETQPRQRLQ